MKRRLALVVAVLCAFGAGAADFLGSLPAVSTVIPGYVDADSVASRLEALPLCPAEGFWRLADGGALFAIERERPSTGMAPTRLRMVMVRSPWRSIRPGTVLGHVVPTGRQGVYEARIYSAMAQRTGLDMPRGFTLTLNDSRDMITFKPFKFPLRVNLLRLLPYMYRRVIEPQTSRPEGLDGAVRVAPASDVHPLSTVYL